MSEEMNYLDMFELMRNCLDMSALTGNCPHMSEEMNYLDMFELMRNCLDMSVLARNFKRKESLLFGRRHLVRHTQLTRAARSLPLSELGGNCSSLWAVSR